MNRWIIAVALFIVALLVFDIYHTNFFSTAKNSIKQVFNGHHQLVYVGVISGSEFDLKLLNGRRIHACLMVDSTPEARQRVVRLINESELPKVVLHNYDENRSLWVVDLYFSHSKEGEFNLAEWLKQEGLVWENKPTLQRAKQG